MMAERRHSHLLRPTDIVLSLGSNQKSAIGDPRSTVMWAVERLRVLGACDTYVKPRFLATRPVGRKSLQPFVNILVWGKTDLSTRRILQLCKRLEWEAGRRPSLQRWVSRPLDVDIIAHGTRVIGWPRAENSWTRLSVPHPEMQRRAFVLVPMCDVLPLWMHPAIGRTGTRLLQALTPYEISGVKLDSSQAR